MSEAAGNKKDFQKPYIPWKENPDAYCFDLDQYGFPVFSDKNLRLVWAMVENDSDYNSVSKETVTKVYRDALKGDDGAIKQAVYLTDKINSTHLSVLGATYSRAVKSGAIKSVAEQFNDDERPISDSDNPKNEENENKWKISDPGNPKNKIKLNNGRLLTALGIIKNKDDLMDWIVAEDAEKNSQAVFGIAHYSQDYVRDELGLSDFKKNNFSFATKFCHYICLEAEQDDRYCIYDSVVGDVLPYYIWVYSEHPDLQGKLYKDLSEIISDCVRDEKSKKAEIDEKPKDYGSYREYYDSVINGIDEWRKENGQDGLKVPGIGEKGKLGYQHVDKLIWYYFKGRRLNKATKEFINLIT